MKDHKIPAPSITLKILPDFSEGISALQELTQLAQASPQIVKRFINLPIEASQLFSIHTDQRAADGTHQLRIKLQPTQRLTDCLTALRTLKVES